MNSLMLYVHCIIMVFFCCYSSMKPYILDQHIHDTQPSNTQYNIYHDTIELSLDNNELMHINHFNSQYSSKNKSEADHNSNHLDSKIINFNESIHLQTSSVKETNLSSYYGDEHVDWRENGIVSEVKTQGECGSCWAISGVEAVESAYAKKYQKLISFSTQQIMDCEPYSRGCDGGYTSAVFRYIKNNGIQTEQSYPYEFQKMKCRYNRSIVIVHITKFVRIKPNEISLMNAIRKYGPISATIDSNLESFITYKSGIYYEPNCHDYNVNHGVLIVGYGIDKALNNTPYYIVKNSWSTNWGENGYIRMSRFRNNNCGIASKAYYVVI